VAHACNPNSGGTDQEDHSSKPVQANSSSDPVLKKQKKKTGWRSGSSSKSACLVSVRPWDQTPMPPKGKNKENQIGQWEEYSLPSPVLISLDVKGKLPMKDSENVPVNLKHNMKKLNGIIGKWC
jgi:hypothetical protein